MEDGFTDMDALVLIDEEDLKALVPKAGHRKRLADEALKMVQQQVHEETHQAGEESEQGTPDVANFLSKLRLDAVLGGVAGLVHRVFWSFQLHR